MILVHLSAKRAGFAHFRYSGESGAALIELALTLSILIMFSLGVIEYGFGIKDYQLITAAARAGARSGSAFSVDFPTSACTDLQTAAKSITERYITENKLGLSHYVISANTCTHSIDTLTFKVIQVQIDRSISANLFPNLGAIMPTFLRISTTEEYPLNKSPSLNCSPPPCP